MERFLRTGYAVLPHDTTAINLPNRLKPKQVPLLEKIVAKLLEQEVIREINNSEATFVLPMFLVPKPGQPGEWRFIFDGRELNDRIAAAQHQLRRNAPVLPTSKIDCPQNDTVVGPMQ